MTERKEMSDQVRAVLFVVFVMVITFVWLRVYKPPTPPPQTPSQTVSQTAPVAGTAQPSAAQASLAPALPAAKIPVVEATVEKIVTVESPLYHIEISNRGAVVRSWTLKKYFDDQKPPRPLDLVNSATAQELGWPFSVSLSDAQLEAEANAGLYQVTTSARGAEPLVVT